MRCHGQGSKQVHLSWRMVSLPSPNPLLHHPHVAQGGHLPAADAGVGAMAMPPGVAVVLEEAAGEGRWVRVGS